MKIAIVASRFPYPLEKGDKLRLYHHIRLLSVQHDIHLFALNEATVDPKDRSEIERFCASVQVYVHGGVRAMFGTSATLFSDLPAQSAYFLNRHIRRQMQADIRRCMPDVIYCQLVRMTEYVRALPFPKVLDYMDAFSQSMWRMADQRTFPFRQLLRSESRRLLAYEQAVFHDFDRHAIISSQDTGHFPEHLAGRIRVVPNGVDLTYFRPIPNRQPAYDLVFVGNMGYYPNIAAAQYLVREVLPLIQQKHPKVRLLIAGARPSPTVQQLTRKNVTVSGWLEDIRMAYADGMVFVAPIFSGAGQQNKILEAMACGMACVTSSQVNNAIGAANGKAVLIADDAESFAKAVLRLLADTKWRSEVAGEARQLVETKYHWDRIAGLLDNLFDFH